MKPGTSVLQSTRLLDQVRERIRYMHYSLKTDKACLYWIRFFVRWHGRNGVTQHPRAMGAAEVEAFLSMLANERQVSVSNHNQALSALLFLYREVLGIDLPWLNDLNRPARKRRIPSVLTREEVAALFQFLDGERALLAKLLDDTGTRLMEIQVVRRNAMVMWRRRNQPAGSLGAVRLMPPKASANRLP